MVRDEVWEAASRDGHLARILCIGCLEQRLGQRLAPNDFSELGINEPSGLESDRLLDRVGVVDSEGKAEA
jgi:hypothetical protein